ncbi:MAG: hypothetical protein ACR2IM_06635 [Sediminibacterium sp.]|jgi:hypothetical protein
MKKLLKVLNDFEKLSPQYLTKNLFVSEGDIGWHIIHSCLVITSVTKAITASDPTQYKNKFSWKAFFILLFNKIPRGKAKAPSFTQPAHEVTLDLILQHIAEARKSAELLLTTPNNKYFTHPIFGDMHVRLAIKFLYVHSYHHKKIINDIIQ